ncbi:MAG: DUF488 domain-containing protein [Alphaproteobacteria bacterium]
MTKRHPLYTIGYEGAVMDDLIATLRRAGVADLIDVRTNPYSRRPEFIGQRLAASLSEAGIEYRWERALGNPEAGRGAARAGAPEKFLEIFDAHMATPAGRAALDRVAALATARPAALMCLERDPAQCHRRLVARHVTARTGQAIEPLFPASLI